MKVIGKSFAWFVSFALVLGLAVEAHAATPTLSIIASGRDGENAATCPLQYTVNMTSKVAGTSNTAVTWAVSGAGSITQSGAYWPPSTMPSNTRVTITATLQENDRVKASYTCSLTNPSPGEITGFSPSKLTPGVTNTVTAYGSHFVHNTTILVNGEPVASTYMGSGAEEFSVTLPDNATGQVAISASSPSPGGGSTAAVQLPAATQSITLTATSSDGTNTGTVRLGGGVSIRAVVSTPGSPLLNWTMTGAGSISTNGYGSEPSGAYYTIGQTMPSDRNVTVTATLAANPSVHASYSFTVVNAIPKLASVAPALKSDQAQQIAIAGSGFAPGSVVIYNGSPASTTYLDYGHLTAQVSTSDTQIGPIPIQVQNPAPGGGTSITIEQPITPKTVQVGSYNATSTNPTTVQMGQSLQFLNSITSGPGDPTCTWSIQGAGWISSTGLYHAPTSISGSATVTVNAALVTNPAAVGTYTFTLVYPPPTITETYPTTVASGATTEISIRGSGFTPSTVLLAKGSAISVTYHSFDLITASIVTTAGETGSISLAASNPAQGGGGGSSNSFSLKIGTPATASAQVLVAPGHEIPADFLGFSHEWSGLQWLLGSSETQPNYVYRQLITNLMNGTSYPFLIRIGGNSVDTLASVQPTTAQAELAAALNTHFTLSLNMGANDPNLAESQAQAYAAGMPAGSITAFELGNEPDNYVTDGYRSGTYATTWDTKPFLDDYATWSCAIHHVASSIPLVGPSWANAQMLGRQLGNFEGQEARAVKPQGCSDGQYQPAKIVSQHLYGGYIDGGLTLPSDYLLRPSSATSGPSMVAASVQLAHLNNQLFRIGEINSVDVGGQAGVSDTFQSALWATDIMFEYANAGVNGVNWHGNENCLYCAFTFTIANVSSKNIYTADKIAPLYYGMLLFQKAASNGAKLLPVTVQTTANIKVWATEDQTGTIHVVVLNKDTSFSGNVSISLPGYGTAQLTQLLAPSYQSTNGITLGGQTFDGSIDGTPQGDAISLTVGPTDGVYVVPVDPVSAALLTITN